MLTARREAENLRRQLQIALDALDSCASWNEGQMVSGNFDEPGAASAARAALVKIRGGDGRPPARRKA